MRFRLIDTGTLAPGGTAFALRCADNVLRGTDRRRPESGAVAAWLDEHRDRLRLPDGEDFCPGKDRRAALPHPPQRAGQGARPGRSRRTPRRCIPACAQSPALPRACLAAFAAEGAAFRADWVGAVVP